MVSGGLEGRLVRRGRDEVQERMTHEGARHPGVAVEPLFEGEDDQHAAHQALQNGHAAGAAGPDLRADEVIGRNPCVPGQAQDAAVEAVIVDADQDCRTALLQEALQAQAQPHQEPHFGHRLPEAGDGVRGEVLQEFVGFPLQERAAHRGHAGSAGLERSGQVGAVQVSGRVAGHDEDEGLVHGVAQGAARGGQSPRRMSLPTLLAMRPRSWAQDGIKDRACA